MNCNLCYRGITYRQAGSAARLAAESRRPPVILRYRGLLYVSGSCNFAGTFLKP